MNATTEVTNPTRGPGAALLLGLAALLAAQIGLALWIQSRGADSAPSRHDAPLLAFATAEVDRIRIEHAGTAPVTLERAEGGWRIATLADFPAATGRVDALLGRLAELKRGLPVATSTEAQARFKVGDSDPGRITLATGDRELAVLHLGEAAGLRRQYARPAGDSAVYEAELTPADLPAKADDWANRALLRRDERDVLSIAMPGITLERGEDGWGIKDLAPGETLSQAAADELVRRLRDLSFTSVLGREAKPEYGQDAPVLDVRLGLASGDTPVYRLSRQAQAPGAGTGGLVLKVSDQPWYFLVADWAVEPLLKATRAGLLVQSEPQSDPLGAPQGSAGAVPEANSGPGADQAAPPLSPGQQPPARP
jgi:hypothetical protein